MLMCNIVTYNSDELQLEKLLILHSRVTNSRPVHL